MSPLARQPAIGDWAACLCASLAHAERREASDGPGHQPPVAASSKTRGLRAAWVQAGCPRIFVRMRFPVSRRPRPGDSDISERSLVRPHVALLSSRTLQADRALVGAGWSGAWCLRPTSTCQDGRRRKRTWKHALEARWRANSVMASGRKESGAGDGNRTHVSSLGSCSSTIELHPLADTDSRQLPGRRQTLARTRPARRHPRRGARRQVDCERPEPPSAPAKELRTAVFSRAGKSAASPR